MYDERLTTKQAERSGGTAEADSRAAAHLLEAFRSTDFALNHLAPFLLTTELLDVRDVELARITSPDDFVVSEQLASLLMTQLAENPELGAVFADLFDSFESELMLKPAHMYVPLDRAMRFEEVVSAARGFQEIAIGYRRHGRGADDGEIVINPAKSREVSFSEQDHLIVLTTS